MARQFASGSSQYLSALGVLVADVPLTMSAWFYADSAASMSAMFHGDKDNINLFWAIGYYHSGVQVGWAQMGGAGYADTSNTVAPSNWAHIVGIFAASDDRTSVLNGDWANRGTNADNRPMGTVDTMAIGGNRDSTPGAYFNGRIAEAAIWNVALTQDEVSILAAGYSPLFVRPQGLQGYWPLVRDQDYNLITGASLTPSNAPTIASHCPIMYPSPTLLGREAPGGTSILFGRMLRGTGKV